MNLSQALRRFSPITINICTTVSPSLVKNWFFIPQKQVFMKKESVSMIKMKSPDILFDEQDSQIALSCFHYDWLLMLIQCKKRPTLVTSPDNAQDSTICHLKSTLLTKQTKKWLITLSIEIKRICWKEWENATLMSTNDWLLWMFCTSYLVQILLFTEAELTWKHQLNGALVKCWNMSEG